MIERMQFLMHRWSNLVFGERANEITPHIRSLRLLEEVLELNQADGSTLEEIVTIVRQVYTKPAGYRDQEVGGVATCLMAYCDVAGLSLEEAFFVEFARIMDPKMMEKVRYRNLEGDKIGFKREAIAASDLSPEARQLLEAIVIPAEAAAFDHEVNDDLKVTSAEVLAFIDFFAGQENTAEDVRDFVQLAARYVEEGKTRSEFKLHPMLDGFIEWLERDKPDVASYEGQPSTSAPISDCWKIFVDQIRDLTDSGYDDASILAFLKDHFVTQVEHSRRVTELIRYNSEQVIERRVTNARLKAALEALQEAARAFRNYARQHREKDTVGGSVKALRNDAMASMCERAMTVDINPDDYGKA